ncbi:MAG: hypothetical protein KGI58_00030 [Patescibacteria group bacterium]|nr:hypothetical protein [Patescibacteria group bacterium]
MKKASTNLKYFIVGLIVVNLFMVSHLAYATTVVSPCYDTAPTSVANPTGEVISGNVLTTVNVPATSFTAGSLIPITSQITSNCSVRPVTLSVTNNKQNDNDGTEVYLLGTYPWVISPGQTILATKYPFSAPNQTGSSYFLSFGIGVELVQTGVIKGSGNTVTITLNQGSLPSSTVVFPITDLFNSKTITSNDSISMPYNQTTATVTLDPSYVYTCSQANLGSNRYVYVWSGPYYYDLTVDSPC